jgi:hypothetical protein
MPEQEYVHMCCSMALKRIFHSYRDITIAGEELQNLNLCIVVTVIEEGWIFIVPHLM